MRVSAVVSLLLLAFAPGLPSAVQQDQSTPYKISTNVDLVTLEVRVLDRKGSFVAGLTDNDFRVLEDGVAQQIRFFHHEDVPVTVGLVVDNSGSMRPKRSDVVSAAVAFATASNPQDEMFVVNFNDYIDYGLPRGQKFTGNLQQLRSALFSAKPEGRTALYDAVAAALEHLKLGQYEQKALLLVSDGEDNSSAEDFDSVLELARRSGATIYCVAVYDPEQDRHNTRVLKQLSRVSGGQFYFPRSPDEIGTVCRQIARDIRSRYTIAYSSTNQARDGTYRRVTVSASSPLHKNLAVRVREGYFAPRDDSATHR